MNINIKKIFILVGTGTDKISVHTDMPYPYNFNPEDQKLELSFSASPRKGLDYVKNNFRAGIDVEVVDARTGEKTCLVTTGPPTTLK